MTHVPQVRNNITSKQSNYQTDNFMHLGSLSVNSGGNKDFDGGWDVDTNSQQQSMFGNQEQDQGGGSKREMDQGGA